ncbi:MAG: hypothetical protein IKN55_11165 [Oscillospiraceae bacterium]|nr:hypothetical protein [Oscillospiraceae bacterium]
MDERMKKVEALMQDQEFVKAAMNAENEEAVQKLFSDNGVEMSIDEIVGIRDTMLAVIDGKISGEQLEKAVNGELSEEELAQAAGGLLTGGPTLYVAQKGLALLGYHNATLDQIVDSYGKVVDKVSDVCDSVVDTVKDGVVTGYNAVKDSAVTGYNWVKDNITRW